METLSYSLYTSAILEPLQKIPVVFEKQFCVVIGNQAMNIAVSCWIVEFVVLLLILIEAFGWLLVIEYKSMETL